VMMEELEPEEGRTVQRLSEFLPPDLRMKILSLVKGYHKDGNMLERDAGLRLQEIKEGSLNDYFPRILAFALINIPIVREVIRKDLLGEVGSLCEDLGIVISEEGKLKGGQKEQLGLFLAHIDGKSREIVWYLLRNRYAGIRDLSDLIGASADNDVLTRIREVINPTAKKYLKKEILEFKQSAIDESSGKKVIFKWWLRTDLPFTKNKEEKLDVFDEPDNIRIIAEMPPAVTEKDIKVELKKDIVRIIANATNGRYERKVPLFFAVEEEVEMTFRNRILAIMLIKKRKIKNEEDNDRKRRREG
jgi:HSP20 family molecular chaperone IbpA